MSQVKMLKNERKNRRKAFWITAFVHLGLLGGIFAYNGLDSISAYLPEQAKEWLNIEMPQEQPKETKTKKPHA